VKNRLVIVLILTTLLMTGCETFSGLGRDLKNTGKWIQEKTN